MQSGLHSCSDSQQDLWVRSHLASHDIFSQLLHVLCRHLWVAYDGLSYHQLSYVKKKGMSIKWRSDNRCLCDTSWWHFALQNIALMTVENLLNPKERIFEFQSLSQFPRSISLYAMPRKFIRYNSLAASWAEERPFCHHIRQSFGVKELVLNVTIEERKMENKVKRDEVWVWWMVFLSAWIER